MIILQDTPVLVIRLYIPFLKTALQEFALAVSNMPLALQRIGNLCITRSSCRKLQIGEKYSEHFTYRAHMYILLKKVAVQK